jgi:hypothetical protein
MAILRHLRDAIASDGRLGLYRTRKSQFIEFIGETSQWVQVETRHRHHGPHPKLYQWRMLGIKPEITKPQVRGPRGNVVGLVHCESIQARCNGRAQDRQRDQEQRKPYKNFAFHDE